MESKWKQKLPHIWSQRHRINTTKALQEHAKSRKAARPAPTHSPLFDHYAVFSLRDMSVACRLLVVLLIR